MRLFEEQASVSRSYIHGVEQGKLLPSPEKLEKLAEVFVSVAQEQDAADPQGDAQKLFYEREKTAIIERLGFDPKLADSMVSLRHLKSRQRADLALPLSEALKLFRKLEAKERSALGPFIKEFVDFYDALDAETKRETVLKIYEAIYQIRRDTESAGNRSKAKTYRPQVRTETSTKARKPKKVSTD